jgi:hypothetical protein
VAVKATALNSDKTDSYEKEDAGNDTEKVDDLVDEFC